MYSTTNPPTFSEIVFKHQYIFLIFQDPDPLGLPGSGTVQEVGVIQIKLHNKNDKLNIRSYDTGTDTWRELSTVSSIIKHKTISTAVNNLI